MLLLSAAYFPPIEYFVKIAKYSAFYIEAHEHYCKQSYRNRCLFYTENGIQNLLVPVVHEEGWHNCPVTEIKVDYSTPWVIRTKRAIQSAYSSAAFFDYYRDQVFSILDSHPQTLFELDCRSISFFLEKFAIEAEMRFTPEYIPVGDPGWEDFRNIIHPKRKIDIPAENKKEKPYFQVFSGKHGFISGLSAMDLLFNEGPESAEYIRNASRA